MIVYPVKEVAAIGNRVVTVAGDVSSPFVGARVFKHQKGNVVVAPIGGRYSIFDIKESPEWAHLEKLSDMEEFSGKGPNSIIIVSGNIKVGLYGIDFSDSGLPPKGDIKQGEALGLTKGNLSWYCSIDNKAVDPIQQSSSFGGIVTLEAFEKAKAENKNPDLANTAKDESKGSSSGIGATELLAGAGALWLFFGKKKRR